MIRMVIVDDQEVVREGLSRIFSPRHGFDVVAECADGAEALEVVPRVQPELVLMDVRMKPVDGIAATRSLRALPDAPPVLVLTTYDDDDTLAGAFGAGASGFVLKDAPGAEMHRAARAVAAGGGWIDPTVAGRVIDRYRAAPVPRDRTAADIGCLTPRERQVLELLARGASNREIAQALAIGGGTVKTHVGNVLAKLHVRDRVAAVVLAFEQGVVPASGR